MNYGSIIKYLREEKELTQMDLSKLLKIDHSQYSHYEVEDRTIPIKHLNALCNYFEISLDYVFGFTDINIYDDYKKQINSKLSGKRLKEFRKENKLTLIKLGEILNCSYGTIAGYESGRYLIATPFLYDLCKKYNISADYLLGKIDSPKYLK